MASGDHETRGEGVCNLSKNLRCALIFAVVPLLLAAKSARAGEGFDGWNFYSTQSVTNENGQG
jgi:hypothetical protein